MHIFCLQLILILDGSEHEQQAKPDLELQVAFVAAYSVSFHLSIVCADKSFLL